MAGSQLSATGRSVSSTRLSPSRELVRPWADRCRRNPTPLPCSIVNNRSGEMLVLTSQELLQGAKPRRAGSHAGRGLLGQSSLATTSSSSLLVAHQPELEKLRQALQPRKGRPSSSLAITRLPASKHLSTYEYFFSCTTGLSRPSSMPFGRPVLSPLHGSREDNFGAAPSANACINLDATFVAAVAPKEGSAMEEAAIPKGGWEENLENPFEPADVATSATDVGEVAAQQKRGSVQSDEAVIAAIAKNLYGNGGAANRPDGGHKAPQKPHFKFDAKRPPREATEEQRIAMVEKACKLAAFGVSSEEEVAPAVAAACVEAQNAGISRIKLAAIAGRVVSRLVAKTNKSVAEVAAAAGDAARQAGEAIGMTVQQAEIAATIAEKQVWQELGNGAEEVEADQQSSQDESVLEEGECQQ